VRLIPTAPASVSNDRVSPANQTNSIALVKNEIRIVQASLLGSILANLLLILGMSFFLGGLRFREQIYNSTVTQMSACLLSLSVISLVLPVCLSLIRTAAILTCADGLPRLLLRL
jgi:calcium/proton exchanger cax